MSIPWSKVADTVDSVCMQMMEWGRNVHMLFGSKGKQRELI
jgi:hypothetical protein